PPLETLRRRRPRRRRLRRRNLPRRRRRNDWEVVVDLDGAPVRLALIFLRGRGAWNHLVAAPVLFWSAVTCHRCPLATNTLEKAATSRSTPNAVSSFRHLQILWRPGCAARHVAANQPERARRARRS